MLCCCLLVLDYVKHDRMMVFFPTGLGETHIFLLWSGLKFHGACNQTFKALRPKYKLFRDHWPSALLREHSVFPAQQQVAGSLFKLNPYCKAICPARKAEAEASKGLWGNLWGLILGSKQKQYLQTRQSQTWFQSVESPAGWCMQKSYQLKCKQDQRLAWKHWRRASI